jgi:hypothetical protein
MLLGIALGFAVFKANGRGAAVVGCSVLLAAAVAWLARVALRALRRMDRFRSLRSFEDSAYEPAAAASASRARRHPGSRRRLRAESATPLPNKTDTLSKA